MKIQIECLPEPKLAFGQGKTGLEPRRLLAKAGPADAGRLTNVRLALVGTAADVEAAKPWLLKLNGFLPAHEGNSARYREWPGAPSALGVQFSVDDTFVRRVDEQRLQLARASRITLMNKVAFYAECACIPKVFVVWSGKCSIMGVPRAPGPRLPDTGITHNVRTKFGAWGC